MSDRLTITVAQDFAATDMVGRADIAILFHAIDQAGSAVIADAKLALDPARRGLLAFEDNLARLAVHRIFRAVIIAQAIEREPAIFGLLGDRLDIIWLTLPAPSPTAHREAETAKAHEG